MSGNSGNFKVGDKSVDFPIKSGTIGPDVIDIGKLYDATGRFTYDPGFLSTAACESKITYIDGDAGILLHRGYPIEQLADHGDFLETCYLLLYGELPTAAQKADFDYRVTRHTMVHDQMSRFFQGLVAPTLNTRGFIKGVQLIQGVDHIDPATADSRRSMQRRSRLGLPLQFSGFGVEAGGEAVARSHEDMPAIDRQAAA